MNEVWLKGKAAKDSEAKISQNGKKYVRFSLATTRFVKDQKHTDWHNVTIIGDKACSVRKGDDVLVVGSYVTETWTDQHNQKRTAQNVLGFSMRVKSKEIPMDSSDNVDYNDYTQDTLGKEYQEHDYEQGDQY